MSARTFFLLLAGMLGAAVLLTFTFVTAAAVVYTLTQGDPGPLKVYLPILLGCLLAWALVGLAVRHRRSGTGAGGD